ncbi:PREDICTED: kinesin-like protein KIF19 isoform X1 [Gavialis gangeticus]|uniref:kinesin-like protein KIF19 isoform X1 n=1 Tax=Gavialis gangeticus TaxID=94835 RepID=UPI00092F9BD4|nr:PREDICTED: kinesin-like protein KIF19 isoform X1 [Gavialis gangeticus]
MGQPDVRAMPTAVCGSGAPRGSPLVPAVFQVALRIRPISMAELEEGATLIAHRVDEQVVVLMDPMEDPDDILRANRSREKSYVFDVAFDFTATQEVVYRATTKGLIEGVISGYNATVFAYGPTGCGKTYTMLGTDQEPGIYVRTLNDLFRAIEETSDDMEYEVSMSYLEIYNEMIRDLLNPALGYLDLREDSKGIIQVAGITEVSTINAKEVMQLLTKGNKQRTQEPTAANLTSSRSHAVLQVTVRQKSRVRNVLQEIRLGRLFMIDLAGSERASQTQNRGQRMKEGAHINRSLLALGNCINALSDRAGAKYVNYRDSKLTRLLKDSLGGNSRTVMIAHISPASTAFEESRSTLTYADRAKNIRTTVKRNLLNVSYHIAQYTSIISDLRREIQRLKGKIDQQGSRPALTLAPGLPDHGNIRHIQAEVQLHSSQCTRRDTEQLQAQLVGTFQEQMDVRRHLLTLDNACTEVQLESSRHLLTVADWEQEKTQRAQKRRGERRKETRGKDESEKDSDTGDDQSDVPEPPEVAAAREAIAALLGEQKKLHKQKGELERRLRELQQRGRRLEEALPRPVGAEEQREALGLLCRVRQLEAESADLQLHRDDAAQRFEQHRRLCHQIIRQQRQLIREYHLSVPRHLEELYEIYLRELEEGGLDRVASKTLKLPQLPAGDGALDSDQESVRTLGSEPPAQRDSRRSTLPPLVGEAESDPAQMFKASPRAQLLKSSAVQTPPPIHVNGLVTQECLPRDSLVSLGSQRTSSPDSGELCTDFALAHRAERKEILSGTKSIAVKAARRRSRALECDRLPLLEPAKEPSSLSLHSLSESEDPLSPATPLGRRAPSPGLPHATSEDNLSSSTGEAGSQAGGTLPNRSPGPWLRAHKKGSKKLERREESLDAKRRKRRSRSFEVTGHGLSGLKSNVPRCRPLETSSEHWLLGGSQLAPPARVPSKAPLHLAKVRLPQSQPPGPGDSPTLPLALAHPGGLKKGPATSQRARPGYIARNAGSKDGRSHRY